MVSGRRRDFIIEPSGRCLVRSGHAHAHTDGVSYRMESHGHKEDTTLSNTTSPYADSAQESHVRKAILTGQTMRANIATQRLEQLDEPRVGHAQQQRTLDRGRLRSECHMKPLPTVPKYGRLPKLVGISAAMPSENHIGTLLGGTFRVQNLLVNVHDIEIYAVVDLAGETFEAQVFPLRASDGCDGPSDKLFRERKRKIKRLFRSRNFVREIEQEGKRFLISRVVRSVAEWNNLWRKHEHDKLSSKDQGLEAQSPATLLCDRQRRASFSSDDSTLTEARLPLRGFKCSRLTDLQDTKSIFSRPPSSCDSHNSCYSHTEGSPQAREHDSSEKMEHCQRVHRWYDDIRPISEDRKISDGWDSLGNRHGSGLSVGDGSLEQSITESWESLLHRCNPTRGALDLVMDGGSAKALQVVARGDVDRLSATSGLALAACEIRRRLAVLSEQQSALELFSKEWFEVGAVLGHYRLMHSELSAAAQEAAGHSGHMA